LGKVNLITFPGIPNTGTDGLQSKTGNAKVYVTFGTNRASTNSTVVNTLTELVTDVQKIQKNIAEFNGVIFSNNKFVYDKIEYEGKLVFETNNGVSKEVTTEQVFLPFSKSPSY